VVNEKGGRKRKSSLHSSALKKGRGKGKNTLLAGPVPGRKRKKRSIMGLLPSEKKGRNK